MGTVVLDSSILLGLVDPEDALHGVAVEALRQRSNHDLVVPASVLAEILVAAMRHGERTAKRMETVIDDLASQIYPIDREVARAAAAIRAQRSAIRLPDALVLAVGQILQAEVVTADKQWRNQPGHVTVIEP